MGSAFLISKTNVTTTVKSGRYTWQKKEHSLRKK